eukprot:685666-Rhodomonas_salina.5
MVPLMGPLPPFMGTLPPFRGPTLRFSAAQAYGMALNAFRDHQVCAYIDRRARASMSVTEIANQGELKNGAEAIKLKGSSYPSYRFATRCPGLTVWSYTFATKIPEFTWGPRPPGVGKKIAAKFDEFLARCHDPAHGTVVASGTDAVAYGPTSGSVGRVDRDRADPRNVALAALTSAANRRRPCTSKRATGRPPLHRQRGLFTVSSATSLRNCFALSGTDVAYCAIRKAVEGGRVSVSHAVKVSTERTVTY